MQSCLTLCSLRDCSLTSSSVGEILQPFPSQWDFPTQWSSPGLPHCRQILYHLSYQGSLILWPPDTMKNILMLGKIEGRRRRDQQRMRWLEDIINSIGMTLSKLWEIVKNREAWCATVYGVTPSWTWLSDWFMMMIRCTEENIELFKVLGHTQAGNPDLLCFYSSQSSLKFLLVLW